MAARSCAQCRSASWRPGTSIVVDPGFRKGNFHVPVRFEWHGDEATLRRELGLPEATGPDDRLEVRVFDCRKKK